MQNGRFDRYGIMYSGGASIGEVRQVLIASNADDEAGYEMMTGPKIRPGEYVPTFVTCMN